MANQMIALGARAPQMPDLGRATQQFGALLSTAAQQRASQRQAEQASQAMDIARAQEGRAIAQHEIEQAGRQIDYYTRLAVQTMNPAGYELFLGRLDRDAPEIAALFRTNMPPENFDRGTLLQMVGSISDNFRANFGPLETQIVQDADTGAFGAAVTGGVRPSGVFQLPEYRLATEGEGAAPETPTAPAATPTARAPAGGADLTPQDLMDQGIPESAIPMGDPRMRPVSAGGMAAPAAPVELTMDTAPQIIQNAVQNRVIDQTHLQQLRSMVGPDNERSLASWMQQNQIRIQPTGEAPISPGMRTAEYRPGMGAEPQFQQVQAVTGPGGATYVPTGRVARGRPPMQAPLPGSAQVPIPRVREEATAQEAGRQGVRVATEPQIRAGEARATRLETLRAEAPRARNDVDSFLSHSANRIDAIDRMLRSRSYEIIVGPIEGRLPGMLHTPRRAVAQRLLDTISNTDVLQDIISARGQTETGGSPLGNVSNSDLQLYIRAANELEQTGDEGSFRQALLRMRRQLVGGMRRARRTYDDTFRPLGEEMSNLRLETPEVSAEYTPGRPSGGTRTPTRRAPTRTRGGAAVSNW